MLGLFAHAGVAIVLAVAGSFETLALISGGAICLVFAAVAVSAWRAQQLDLRGHGASRWCCPAARWCRRWRC